MKKSITNKKLATMPTEGPAYFRIPISGGRPRRDQVLEILKRHLRGRLVYVPMSQFMTVSDFVEKLRSTLHLTNGTEGMLANSDFRYLVRILAIKCPNTVLVFDNCSSLDKIVKSKLINLVSVVHNSCVLVES